MTLPTGFGSGGSRKNNSTQRKPLHVNMWHVTAVVMPLLAITMAFQSYEFGIGTPYQLEQIGDMLTNEQTTSNIDAKIQVLQSVSDKLSTWHGNPQFWWPTVYENLDDVRNTIDQTVSNINELKKDPNNMAYQQAVGNLDKSTSSLQDRIAHISGTYGMNPNYNALGWILLFVGFASPAYLKVIDVVLMARYWKTARDYRY